MNKQEEMTERLKDARLAEIRQFVNDVNNDLADDLSVADDHRLELLNAMDAERAEVERLEAKIAELKNLIADLQCTGVYCGLDGCLCDNCRIRLKVFGDK